MCWEVSFAALTTKQRLSLCRAPSMLTARRCCRAIADAHVYLNHVDALKQQLDRTPRAFPTLSFKRQVGDIDQFTFEDLELKGYKPLEAIKMTMAV